MPGNVHMAFICKLYHCHLYVSINSKNVDVWLVYAVCGVTTKCYYNFLHIYANGDCYNVIEVSLYMSITVLVCCTWWLIFLKACSLKDFLCWCPFVINVSVPSSVLWDFSQKRENGLCHYPLLYTFFRSYIMFVMFSVKQELFKMHIH